MEDIIWLIFDLIVNYYQSFLFFFFGFNVLEFKKLKISKYLPLFSGTTILFLFVTLFNYFTAFEGVAIFVYSAILFIFLLIFAKGGIAKKLLISFIPISVVAIVTTFSLNFTSLLFRQNILDLISISSVYRLFLIFLTMSLFSISLYIIARIFRKNEVTLTKTEWISFIAVLTVSIIIFMLLFFIIFSGVSDMAKIYTAFIVILIILTDIMVYVLLVQLSKKHQIETENKLLIQRHNFNTESTNEIKKQYEELAKIRHDFKNTLRIIQELNKDESREEINNYINEFFESQSRSMQIISTENEYVNAIINSKISTARSYGIEVTVSTISDIKSVNNIDLCNILGNLFDNAIDACRLCESKKEIYLEITKDNDNSIIFMKNSIKESVLNSNPELKSTKKNKHRHGYGTRIVRDLSEKYGGFADFYEDNKNFCCNIVCKLF